MLKRFALLLILCCPVFAQQTPDGMLIVDVLDKHSGFGVEGLTASNFRVAVDGKPINVEAAGRETLKNKVCILFDNSGSMNSNGKWGFAIYLTEAAIHYLGSSDVSLVPFSGRDQMLSAAPDIQQSLQQLETMRQWKSDKPLADGRTALWDAIVYAMRQQRLKHGDAILVVTDGGDNDSKTRFPQVRNLVAKNGVRVFSIFLNSIRYREEIQSAFEVKQLTAESGGSLIPFDGLVSKDTGKGPGFSNEQKKELLEFGRYVASRILRPYVLRMQLPPDAAGKLKVEIVDSAGAPEKDSDIVKPQRLESSSFMGTLTFKP